MLLEADLFLHMLISVLYLSLSFCFSRPLVLNLFTTRGLSFSLISDILGLAFVLTVCSSLIHLSLSLCVSISLSLYLSAFFSLCLHKWLLSEGDEGDSRSALQIRRGRKLSSSLFNCLSLLNMLLPKGKSPIYSKPTSHSQVKYAGIWATANQSGFALMSESALAWMPQRMDRCSV